jgi:hypothetical protein
MYKHQDKKARMNPKAKTAAQKSNDILSLTRAEQNKQMYVTPLRSLGENCRE